MKSTLLFLLLLPFLSSDAIPMNQHGGSTSQRPDIRVISTLLNPLPSPPPPAPLPYDEFKDACIQGKVNSPYYILDWIIHNADFLPNIISYSKETGFYEGKLGVRECLQSVMRSAPSLSIRAFDLVQSSGGSIGITKNLLIPLGDQLYHYVKSIYQPQEPNHLDKEKWFTLRKRYISLASGRSSEGPLRKESAWIRAMSKSMNQAYTSEILPSNPSKKILPRFPASLIQGTEACLMEIILQMRLPGLNLGVREGMKCLGERIYLTMSFISMMKAPSTRLQILPDYHSTFILIYRALSSYLATGKDYPMISSTVRRLNGRDYATKANGIKEFADQVKVPLTTQDVRMLASAFSILEARRQDFPQEPKPHIQRRQCPAYMLTELWNYLPNMLRWYGTRMWGVDEMAHSVDNLLRPTIAGLFHTIANGLERMDRDPKGVPKAYATSMAHLHRILSRVILTKAPYKDLYSQQDLLKEIQTIMSVFISKFRSAGEEITRSYLSLSSSKLESLNDNVIPKETLTLFSQLISHTYLMCVFLLRQGSDDLVSAIRWSSMRLSGKSMQ